MILKEKRKAAELTQEQLGELIGVSHSAISQWEKGKLPVPDSRYSDLAEALGVSVGELREAIRYVTDRDSVEEWLFAMAVDRSLDDFVKVALLHVAEMARPGLTANEEKVLTYHGGVDRVAERIQSFDADEMSGLWERVLDSDYLLEHPDSSEVLHLVLPS